MLRMDPTTLRDAADQLRRVAEEHAAWHGDVLRAVLGHGPKDRLGLGPAAYRECALGQWYYERAPNGLREQPAFLAIGREHQRLHQAASRLLRSGATAAAVDRADFDALVAAHGQLQTEIEALRSAIEAAIVHRDPLTGALGRVAMLPTLEALRADVARGDAPCALAFVDVDDLKRINDLHGHSAGDAVLVAVVEHLHARLREDDRVFRYGGDEFLVALPGAGLEAAMTVLTRVRDGLAGQLLATGLDDRAVRVSASFGLALLDPEAGVAESIHRADQAVLLAKAAGRNRIIKWDDSVTTGTRWRRIDEREIPK